MKFQVIGIAFSCRNNALICIRVTSEAHRASTSSMRSWQYFVLLRHRVSAFAGCISAAQCPRRYSCKHSSLVAVIVLIRQPRFDRVHSQVGALDYRASCSPELMSSSVSSSPAVRPARIRYRKVPSTRGDTDNGTYQARQGEWVLRFKIMDSGSHHLRRAEGRSRQTLA